MKEPKKATSAGLAVWRVKNNVLQILLCKLAGPYFSRTPCWSIPKGKVEEGETTADTAIREFREETGMVAPPNPQPLTFILTGKGPCAVWYVMATSEMCEINGRVPTTSNSCTIEWPPKSGKQMTFPETDEMEFFPIDRADEIITPRQREVLVHLKLAVKIPAC